MANTTTIDKFYNTNDSLTPIQYRLIKVLRNGPASRKTLVNKLNAPRTTIYDNLLKLQKRKLIEKFRYNSGMRGRPFVYWRLQGD